jgi:ketosteroid isomerase-like protein
MIESRAFDDTLTEHLEAISDRDIERFARTLHPDVRLVGPNGSMIAGYDDVVAAHRGWFVEPDWTFFPTVLWTGERLQSAWALADVRYVSNGKANRFLLFLLFVRNGGQWKLLFDQNTPITHP